MRLLCCRSFTFNDIFSSNNKIRNSLISFLKKRFFYSLFRRSFNHLFSYYEFYSGLSKKVPSPFPFHFPFRKKFFSKEASLYFFFFFHFFTSLKSVVPLSARSLISDETAQSRGEGLFSYKSNQAAI